MNKPDYDLCVIGGGINGAGIARDAAGRGLSVLLMEQGDLAGATSSASTKLIHGGLRYLEYFEFGLVHHALQEREILLGLAPHIIWPLEFVLPHDANLRPAWMIRTGLLLYDYLGKRQRLRSSKEVDLRGGPLESKYTKGFSYADCWVDDSRLVVLNAMSAAESGARILTRTKCEKLIPDKKNRSWTIHLGNAPPVTARIAVNAAGPWVRQLLEQSGLADTAVPRVRLVKGSHIIVKRMLPGERAYILQQPDRRIVFVIPYENEFTLIGTTETEFTGNPYEARAEREEIEYLCAAVNRSFKQRLAPEDVLWTYSGVRPLLDDGGSKATAVTRDYKLIYDENHGPPLLSVFGGKITTYRHLAEEAVDHLSGMESWTAGKVLPGGNIPDFDKFLEESVKQHAHLPPDLVRRYARSYGTRMNRILKGKMGRDFGGGLFEAEVRYLINNEWARTAEDILWRRTKLGLHVSPETSSALEEYMAAYFTPAEEQQQKRNSEN